ncbi:MAG: DUF72 domain-containing protein [Burkholderiaceae bacterium]
MARSKPVASSHSIRVGIGGWTFAPWRNNFYPAHLPQRAELEYASQQLTAIEVNGTYYSTFKPTIFAGWRDAVPDDFVFSLKANRFASNRRVLAGAGPSIRRFIDSGITELGSKLGPIVWQFMPTKAFDAQDFEAFLALLPQHEGSHRLRHVVDVRHPSFMVPEFVALLRQYHCASVFTDSPNFPSFADLTTPLVYARLMDAQMRFKAGYAPKALDQWARTARDWARGETPATLPRITLRDVPAARRDVLVFFINGAKERAPAAAMALLQRLRTV